MATPSFPKIPVWVSELEGHTSPSAEGLTAYRYGNASRKV